MTVNKFKNLKFYFFLLLILILAFFIYFITDKFKKENKLALEPISINLLTSVHPNLSWNFKSLKSKVTVMPGEVTTIEYFVENLGDTTTSGIATFTYFPNHVGNYISKINCFCYDAQTLSPKKKI